VKHDTGNQEKRNAFLLVFDAIPRTRFEELKARYSADPKSIQPRDVKDLAENYGCGADALFNALVLVFDSTATEPLEVPTIGNSAN
jgi:hypothetical protein